jgi:hypothetical protein
MERAVPMLLVPKCSSALVHEPLAVGRKPNEPKCKAQTDRQRRLADVHNFHWMMTIASVLLKAHFLESMVDSAPSILRAVIPAFARILRW